MQSRDSPRYSGINGRPGTLTEISRRSGPIPPEEAEETEEALDPLPDSCYTALR